jgi:hypothetical protein
MGRGERVGRGAWDVGRGGGALKWGVGCEGGSAGVYDLGSKNQGLFGFKNDGLWFGT